MADDVDSGLNTKELVHDRCGKKHIDKGKWGRFNHARHLCEYCKEFFHDTEASVGV